MRKICIFIFVCSLFGISDAYAQKLVFTRNGIRSSDNILENYIEYAYKDGVSKKDFRSYCIQKMSQPDFFSYKIDYADDNLFKLSGSIKKSSFQYTTFRLNIEMGEQSVKASAELFDKNGKNEDYDQFFSKKGSLKPGLKKFKDELEIKLNEIICSLTEMKVVMR